MVSARRLERIRSTQQILTALAVITLEGGQVPTQDDLASRAGLSTKTVSRHVKEGLDLVRVHERMTSLLVLRYRPDAPASALYGIESLDQPRAGFYGPEAGKDVLQLWAIYFQNLAVCSVDTMSSVLAYRWETALGDFQDSKQSPTHAADFADAWNRRQFDGGVGVSVTGFMQGMARAHTDWAEGHQRQDAADVPSRDASLVALLEPTVRDRLRLASTLGKWIPTDDIRASQHPSRREDEIGFWAGYLFSGDLEQVIPEVGHRLKSLGPLTLHERAELIRYLGVRFMGCHGDHPLAKVFPTDVQRRSAKVLIDQLVPRTDHPDTGMETDIARLQTWAAWIREDYEAVLRWAPLVAGSQSVRRAVQDRKAWTAMPDLIPLLHNAARHTSRVDLAAYMAESARAYLEQPAGLALSTPIPLGLLAQLLALDSQATGDVFVWETESPPTMNQFMLSELRVYLALGGKPDANVIEDLRAITQAAPLQYGVTRLGPFDY